jgi:uncharacterized membrane protein YtjA (UPF0391 family)
MLRWAIVFLIVAIVAAAFGFGLAVTAFASLARLLFWLFLILCVVAFAAGLARGTKRA